MDRIEVSYHYTIPTHTLTPAPAALAPELLQRSITSASTSLNPLLKPIMALWMACAMALCVLSVWGHMLIGLNNDHAVLMDQARKLWAGALPYVDYTDVSPPLIHLIYLLPAIIAQRTGIPSYVTLYSLTYAIMALSLFPSYNILRYNNKNRTGCWLTLSALALAMLVPSFIHQVFADRDHLVIVFSAGWLLLYAPHIQRTSVPLAWRVAVSLLAAIGFAIKPYFYLFYLVAVAFEWRRSGLKALLREPEHQIIIAFAALYMWAIFTYFPQYVFTVLPVGWATYGVIAWPLDSKIAIVTHDLLMGYGAVGLAGAGVLLVTARRLLDGTLLYLLCLMAAAIGTYILGGGWFYTQYPFMAFSLVLAISVGSKLLTACAAITDQGQRYGCLAVVSVVLVAGMVQCFLTPAQWRANEDIQLQRSTGHPLSTFSIQNDVRKKIDAYLDSHPRFMFFSVDIWSVNLLKEGSPRLNVGRFDILWPLPGILQMTQNPEKKEQAAALTEYFTRSIASDLERHRPDLVINDISPYKRSMPPSYNVLDFLKKDPRFTREWAHYTQAESLNGCTPQQQTTCAYEIYTRK